MHIVLADNSPQAVTARAHLNLLMFALWITWFVRSHVLIEYPGD